MIYREFTKSYRQGLRKPARMAKGQSEGAGSRVRESSYADRVMWPDLWPSTASVAWHCKQSLEHIPILTLLRTTSASHWPTPGKENTLIELTEAAPVTEHNEKNGAGQSPARRYLQTTLEDRKCAYHSSVSSTTRIKSGVQRIPRWSLWPLRKLYLVGDKPNTCEITTN